MTGATPRPELRRQCHFARSIDGVSTRGSRWAPDRRPTGPRRTRTSCRTRATTCVVGRAASPSRCGSTRGHGLPRHLSRGDPRRRLARGRLAQSVSAVECRLLVWFAPGGGPPRGPSPRGRRRLGRLIDSDGRPDRSAAYTDTSVTQAPATSTGSVVRDPVRGFVPTLSRCPGPRSWQSSRLPNPMAGDIVVTFTLPTSAAKLTLMEWRRKVSSHTVGLNPGTYTVNLNDTGQGDRASRRCSSSTVARAGASPSFATAVARARAGTAPHASPPEPLRPAPSLRARPAALSRPSSPHGTRKPLDLFPRCCLCIPLNTYSSPPEVVSRSRRLSVFAQLWSGCRFSSPDELGKASAVASR